MKKTLKEIAEFLKGDVIGDGSVIIENIRGIDEAVEGDITFVANPKYRKKLETTGASAVLVSPENRVSHKNLIVVRDPYISLGKLLNLLYPGEEHYPHISEDAFLENDVIISKDATIYPGVYIGKGARIERGVVLYPGVYIGRDVFIGEDSLLYPRVSVYRKCVIGKRVILHAGVVIGSDGFGYAGPGSENEKILQVGIVQIDDDVEVGANTTIDRGTLDKTWIKRGVKIDNLVQIAHNVVIGENSVIAAQVGIAGSTKIGNSVIIGGQVGLVGHITVGDHVMIAAQSGVINNIKSNQVIAGTPHMPHRDWLRVEACVPKLPEMRHSIASIMKRIEELEAKITT